MSTTFVLLLCLGTALAATHVNISIAQHPADVTYVDGKAPTELKAGPDDERSANYRFSNKNSNFEYGNDANSANSGSKGFRYTDRNARIQAVSDAEQQQEQQSSADQKANSDSSSNSNNNVQYYSQNNNRQRSQYRQRKEQEKQNQEFERYIQSYHSGPTVETVFETASPTPQRYEQAPTPSMFASANPNANAAPFQRLVAIGYQPRQMTHTFERQVALTPSTVTALPSSDAERQTHTIVNHQSQPISDPGVTLVAAPSLPSVGSASASGAAPSIGSGIGTIVPYNHQSGYNQSVGVIKPIYEPNNYDYDGQSELYNQYPPAVDESQSGYGFSKGGSGYYGGGHDQSNFYGQTVGFNKPIYEPNNYGYDGKNEFFNQYPSTVGESQGGYGHGNGGNGYYGGGHDQSNFYGQSVGGYLPPQPIYPRPVITKTIQIAQPALKAKKYEIRHPAIQKEYYDIEEHVVIKPAGTVVVELDRPVAKIPKGETILPLGHPHPAVASAYNINGHASASAANTAGVTTVDGSSGLNQQLPGATGNARTSTTIGSTISTMPTYDKSVKDAFVENNLNRQYSVGSGGNSGEAQYVARTTERSYTDGKSINNDDFYVITDSQGNQRTISSKNITPNMLGKDEPDFRYPTSQVEVKNNGAPVAPVSSTYSNTQQSSFNYIDNNKAVNNNDVPSNKPQYQANYNNKNNNNQFRGEFFTGEYFNNNNNNANSQRDSKPARLQEAPFARNTDYKVPETRVHSIHLPPVQHSIYLHRSEQPGDGASLRSRGNSRYEEEAARVLEIKPYLKQHDRPVVVYASTTVRPQQSGNYNQRSEFQRYSDTEGFDDPLQYSAPYANLRYGPGNSVRYTNTPTYANFDSAQQRNAKLLEEIADVQEENNAQSNRASQGSKESRPNTHIQIKIPQHSHEANQPIVISSTISPMVDEQQPQQQRLANQRSGNYEASRYNYHARGSPRGDQGHGSEYGVARAANLESKPDCDQFEDTRTSARYEEPRFAGEQKFLRLVEVRNDSSSGNNDAAHLASVTNIAPENVDINPKSGNGHIPAAAGQGSSRVIAATPAPTDASAKSESFHKRRIAVNHPFQTVREVVEHEPITNYHQVQVNEPSLPAALYQKLPFFETHGTLRQAPADSSFAGSVNQQSRA